MHRLILVDDHILFREGMRSVMSRWSDIEVVGEAADGAEAIKMVRAKRPDLVLMDVSMPVLDGIEATRQIMQELPETRVVMLTMSEDEEHLFEAIRAGASGYVLKNIPSRRLHDQLRGVIRGEALLSGLMAAKILREFNLLGGLSSPPCGATAPLRSAAEPAAATPPPPLPEQSQRGQPAQAGQVDALTGRECQVLQLLAAGFGNREIGQRLCLSENTIKKHLHNVLQKLHLKNRVEAAMYAMRQGLAAE